ncbi:hypothetical protein [Cardinium endosymbiont of Philonthus spinipes]|uniref:hypothetical protein n=1 Tax=Cardinium endosymbiont of Philonthus spinipes TaxID=3077941 RepID=UPI00313EEB42
MEEQIKIQRKKLLISFSGCTKQGDKGEGDKKDNSSDRVNINKGIYGTRNYSDYGKHLSSLQLTYKF